MSDLDEDTRDYYRLTWGFDPLDLRIPLSSGMGYRYERGFQLENDPDLRKAGIEIMARVDYGKHWVSNQIVFRRGHIETRVDCVHTAAYIVPMQDLTYFDDHKILEMAQSTERTPVDIPPEEHFAALMSYVAGIAEIGIYNLQEAGYYCCGDDQEYNPARTRILGFNDLIEHQVNLALQLLRFERWLGIYGALFSLDYQFFRELVQAEDSLRLKIPVSVWKGIIAHLREGQSLNPEEIDPEGIHLVRSLVHILEDPEYTPLQGSLSECMRDDPLGRPTVKFTEYFPSFVLGVGCQDCGFRSHCPYPGVFPVIPILASKITHLDTFIQRVLTECYCAKVRFSLACRPIISPENLIKLADDPEPLVRLAVARKEDAPVEALQILVSRTQMEDVNIDEDVNRQIRFSAWHHPNATNEIRLLIGYLS